MNVVLAKQQTNSVAIRVAVADVSRVGMASATPPTDTSSRMNAARLAAM
jgi:hypothetical protein